MALSSGLSKSYDEMPRVPSWLCILVTAYAVYNSPLLSYTIKVGTFSVHILGSFLDENVHTRFER